MKAAVVLGLVLVACSVAGAQQAEPAVRFEAVDVYVDSGKQELAAYQFELAAEVGEVKIVGVEGGEHEAFARPPYYDPAALTKGRIVIAAFSTAKDLPKGKMRVARLHVQVTGPARPQYAVDLRVAASRDGARIQAEAAAEQGAQP